MKWPGKLIRRTVGHRILLKVQPAPATPLRDRILDVLRRAGADTPAYKGRFEALLAMQKDLTDEGFWDEFSRLPLVTKDELVGRNDDFKSAALEGKFDLLAEGRTPSMPAGLWHTLARKDFFVALSTGGTSGRSAFRWLDYADSQAMAQSFLHSFRRNGWKPGESFVVFYPVRSYFTQTYAEYAALLDKLFGFTMVPFETVDEQSVRRLLETLKSRRAGLLAVFPCVLQRVAEIMHVCDIPPFEKLPCINVSGEFFADCSKRFIQHYFPDSDIQATYGAVEFGEIAHQADSRSSFDYEVFPEYAYVEQGPEDTLLVTALRQNAFPLIRYRIEDRATVHTDTNGRCFLLNLEGKNTDYLLDSAGRRCYASFFNAFVNELNEECADRILHFMLRHDGPALQFNFVLAEPDEELKNLIRGAVFSRIAPRFDHYETLDVAFPDSFAHDYTRKFKIIGEGDGLAEVVGGYYQRRASRS